MPLHSLAHTLADVLADGGWRAKARPAQLPPPGEWNGWLFMAGRGAGKTRAGAEWVSELVQGGVAGSVALVAPTAADARDVMVEGDSGILAVAPNWLRPEYEPSKRRITWPNGAYATTFSSEEPDRLRGPQFAAAWCDELAAWADPQATWDMLQFGLRLGQRPRWLATTTPKPAKLLRDLLAREGLDVVVTRGSTYDNAANLAPTFLEAIRARYEGTRLGRQEIQAELLLDVPGALWTADNLDKHRVAQAPADLRRIVVAIDPAVSNHEGSDLTAIVVAGLAENGHVYVLAEQAGRWSPAEYARRAIDAYALWKADRIVAEINNGGSLIENLLRSTQAIVAYKAVHASRGKVTRAEPVAAIFEQGRAHMVGNHPDLENQMTAFVADFDRRKAGYSPDRVDALVWALTDLSASSGRSARLVRHSFFAR